MEARDCFILFMTCDQKLAIILRKTQHHYFTHTMTLGVLNLMHCINVLFLGHCLGLLYQMV